MEDNKDKNEQEKLHKFLENIKNKAKVVEIPTIKGTIYAPIWYSANAQIEYFKEYHKSKDYRKAFCSLVFSMIKSNIIKINQKISDITINDIEEAEDEYLIKILKLVVAQSSGLAEYYNKYATDNYFEDFYKSVKHEEDKCTEKYKNLFKVPETIKNAISSIQKIPIPKVTLSANYIKSFQQSINTYNMFNYNYINSIYPKCFEIANNLSKYSIDVSNRFKDIATTVNSIKKFSDKVKLINIELIKFGWYTFGDFSISDINSLYSIIERYKSDKNVVKYRRAVNKIMNDFIDSESEDLIENICNMFPERCKIIKDAYNAHKNKSFTLSIPVFLTQTDGISQEILGVSMYSKNKNEPKTKNELENILKDNNVEVKKDSLTYFILYHPLELLSSIIINTWDIDKKYNNNEIYSKFNRHAIIHGADTRYCNKTNSNKCIAILAYLCYLKNKMDEEKES